MYKNQLQELAQRSCFNLPAYACIREGPDHAPRFKAKVNFNGEIFESPTFCSTLRQAEHAAAEVALDVLSKKGPSKALAARVLDETGVYKNLLQETAHRAGLKLPVYTTVRSGPGHVPVFSCTVELAGMSFSGEAAKTKKQAQKNAALIAWAALKNLSKSGSSSSSSSSTWSESGCNDEQEQVTVARYLSTLRPTETNKSAQRDRRFGRGSAPIGRDVISYGRGRSLYSPQCQDWAYSQFPPDVSMYQTWAQERACQQQNQLLALSSMPPSSPRPHIFPFIRSIFQPDQRHYFLAPEQGAVSLFPRISPFLYFSNHSMSVPVRSVSQVTIQEIEEKTQMEQEWFSGDADSVCWKNNFLSDAPRLSPVGVANSLSSFDCHPEKRLHERLQGNDEERKGESAPNIGNSTQPESNQTELYNCVSPRTIDSRFRPSSVSKNEANFRSQNSYSVEANFQSQKAYSDEANFQSRNSYRLHHLQSNVRPNNLPVVSSPGSVRGSVPALFAPPVTVRRASASSSGGLRPGSSNPLTRAPLPMRAATSACSARPWLEDMKNIRGIPSSNFMAPAVHIRSVVPVCSAPPAKKFTSPSQEGPPFSGVERKKPEAPKRDISAASSDLGKPQI